MVKRRRGATRLHSEKSDSGNVGGVIARLLLLALLVGGAVWGTQQLFDPQTFPVRTVRIESQLEHVEQERIRQAVENHVAAGFIGVDVDAVRDGIEAIAWVDRATVRRSWPDRLVIRIEEQRVLARWGSDALLNIRGEVFEAEIDEAMNGLPLLRGPKETNRMVAEQYAAMQQMLSPLGLGITDMSLSERRALTLKLNNDLQLGLGRADADLRLLRFVRVYPQVIASRLAAIEMIDLRYTNGFAVRWRDGYGPESV